LESQRVRCLTEGYLRGWLNFEYPLNTSKLREDLILDYIEDERLFQLLQHKLFMETVIRSSPGPGAKTLDPIFEVSRSLIGLKLPSALPKDKIKKEGSAGVSNKPLTPKEIEEYKALLKELNKNKNK
jgi:hypothetical protein